MAGVGPGRRRDGHEVVAEVAERVDVLPVVEPVTVLLVAPLYEPEIKWYASFNNFNLTVSSSRMLTVTTNLKYKEVNRICFYDSYIVYDTILFVFNFYQAIYVKKNKSAKTKNMKSHQ